MEPKTAVGLITCLVIFKQYFGFLLWRIPTVLNARQANESRRCSTLHCRLAQMASNEIPLISMFLTLSQPSDSTLNLSWRNAHAVLNCGLPRNNECEHIEAITLEF